MAAGVNGHFGLRTGMAARMQPSCRNVDAGKRQFTV